MKYSEYVDVQVSRNMKDRGEVNYWLRLRHVLNMKAMPDENEPVSVMIRNLFDKELLHGSSLILHTEGEKMHT